MHCTLQSNYLGEIPRYGDDAHHAVYSRDKLLYIERPVVLQRHPAMHVPHRVRRPTDHGIETISDNEGRTRARRALSTCQGALMTTYVLLHGAYQGGWIWQPVATRLRAAGHTVYAPTLDGCGERAHLLRLGITVGTQAQEIAQLMFYEDLQEVVLVGTSAGGMVLCKAAELVRERVARLVFVDALALLPGEQVGSIVHRTAPYETTALATGPTTADAERRLFADLPPALRAWALARYTLHPLAALEAPMELDTFWQQPWRATVIRCTGSVNPPEAHQRRTAERLHAAWHDLETGHYPMLSAPEALTGLLVA